MSRLFAFFSIALPFCAAAVAQLGGRHRRGLERRTRNPDERIVSGIPLASGRIVRGRAMPGLWSHYLHHRETQFISPFDGNRVNPQKLQALKEHVSRMENIRIATSNDPRINEEGRQSISQRFNNWSEMSINEENPNSLHHASLAFQQDLIKLGKLHAVLRELDPQLHA
ncbi:uncharacterized protein SPSC_05326 [Sporisorium scitamineum]|uniref:Uncharacterized protein n=1 Tax=Sporisorium scitamineum TaxID=49012 RepID=A0A127ZJ06_9BASI|nr:uncharacterized protein SPSC_05326 [Sporisorium scitamineum]